MAGISSLGIGSGIDINGLLEDLQKVEDKRLIPVANQQKSIEAKINAFSTLKSALSAFNTATERLNDVAVYYSKLVTVNRENVLTAKVNSSALPGKYTIKVGNIATSQTLVTRNHADKDTALGTAWSQDRTLNITLQNGKEIKIELTEEQTSLQGIADAINEKDAGISANIVKLADGTFQLMLSTQETGIENQIATIDSNDPMLKNEFLFDVSNLTGNPSLSQIIAAEDANFTLNSLALSSSSNEIENVITGLSLSLKEASTDPVTITVEATTDTAMNAIKSWVSAFNSLLNTFDNLTKYNPVDLGSDVQDPNNGALLGNGTLRNITQRINDILVTDGNDGAFKVLSEIGITRGLDNRFTINEKKLEEKLSSNRDDVMKLFMGDGETTGLATRLTSYIDDVIAKDGIIAAASEGLEETQKDLKKRFDQISDSIDANIERYRLQFVQLDILLNKLDSTSSYLAQQFEAMNNSNSK